LVLDEATWRVGPGGEEKKLDPKVPVVLLPLPDLFAADITKFNSPGIEPVRQWQAQASLFVRWALDGKNAPRRAGLWQLVEKSALRPVTEPMFHECFGLDYAQAAGELARYLPGAMRHTVTLTRPHDGRSPAYEVRLATDLEISRIKGDWERMEIEFVKL